MSDFIIQIGERVSPKHIGQKLQNRPGIEDRPARIWQFKWGSVIIQAPPGRGYEPFEKDGVIYACIGRPRILGFEHEKSGVAGFCRKIAVAWENDAVDDLLESLTGMFVLAAIYKNGFSIVTDLLGSQPIYQATERSEHITCVGSSADIVAKVTNQSNEIDLASIGEFIVFDQITFPYTTYHHVTEIEPAAVHTWQIDNGEIRTRQKIYWRPVEPDVWAGRGEIADDLESAIRSAAQEISRGASHLAVTLSGGRDSRTVLAALKPYGVEAALTYCSRENRETEIAAQVAKAAGVDHVLVRRDPHFYGTLLERTMNLVGSEVHGEAVGFAISDAGMGKRYDVIVGGYLSDTLLKDHFMPHAQREKFRHKSMRERLRQLVFRPRHADGLGTVWSASLDLLCPEIREQVVQRRRDRLNYIASIRPESAAEWQGFWPVSRQHDVGAAWGNSRLFCSDELFYFRRIIEVAARLSPRDRYAGTAAHDTFNRVCGTLNTLRNANTGVAANADHREEGKYFNRLRRTGQLSEFRSLPASDTPWNDVQHSWADSKMLLLHSPDWLRYRDEVLHSDALDILNSIVSADSCDQIRQFTLQHDPRVNMALIQMGLRIKRNLPQDRT